MPDEEVVEETENEGTGNEGQGSSESGNEEQGSSESGSSESQTSGTGLDIASQTGQTAIAAAIREALSGLGTQMAAAAVTAGNAATLAQSYSEGGTNTRTGENTDNAKYYYQQITSVISQFPNTDGTYILSVDNGSLSWVEVDDGDGGSY